MKFSYMSWSLVLTGLIMGAGCDGDTGVCEYSDSDGFATNCSLAPGSSAIRLNEFSSSGADQVEIVNTSDSNVDIGTWLLTDDVPAQRVDEYSPQGDEEKFVFPANTVIPAKGYVVIPKGSADLAHLFGISKNGEIISLVAPNGELIDQAQSLRQQAKPSFCRIPDGVGEWETCEATFGGANTPVKCGNGIIDANEECDGTNLGEASCTSIADVFIGGELSCTANCVLERRGCQTNAPCDAQAIVLNEVCHKNADCGVAEVTNGDWLEIYNSSDEPAQLGGCTIRVTKDGVVQLETKLVWVAGYETLAIPAGGFALIDNVEDLFDAGAQEDVFLLNAQGELINSLKTSTALSVDGDLLSSPCTIDQVGDTPTPGLENQCTP